MAKKYDWIEKGIYMRGSVYYIAYSRHGKQFKEPVKKARNVTEARRALQSRQGEVVDGRFKGLHHLQTHFAEIALDLISDPEKKNLKDYRGLTMRVRHLLEFFCRMSPDEVAQMDQNKGNTDNPYALAKWLKERKGYSPKADSIGTTQINSYIEWRQEDGAENGTINRELSALSSIYTLAYESQPRKVLEILRAKKLPDGRVREGFVDPSEYIFFKDNLPYYLKGVYMIGYFSGMRKGEICSIKMDQVNWTERKITLARIQTKTNEPRVFFVYSDELWFYMLNQKELRDTKFPECKYLFFTEDGQQIQEFRKTFDSIIIKYKGSMQFACCNCKDEEGNPNTFNLTMNTATRAIKKIPCPHCGGDEIIRADRLFHDLRRTGIKNLIDNGVAQKTAMLISGHKTDEVFRRYLIIEERHIKDACRKVAAAAGRDDSKNLSHFYHTPANNQLFQLSETAANTA